MANWPTADIRSSAFIDHAAEAQQGMRNLSASWKNLPEGRLRQLTVEAIHETGEGMAAMLQRVPSQKGRELHITTQRTMGRFGGVPEPSNATRVENFQNLDDVLAAAENFRQVRQQQEVHVLSKPTENPEVVGHAYADGSYNTTHYSIPLNDTSPETISQIEEIAKQHNIAGLNVNPDTNEIEVYFAGDATDAGQWRESARQFIKDVLGGGHATDQSRIRHSTKRLHPIGRSGVWGGKQLSDYLYGSTGAGPIPGARAVSTLSRYAQAGLESPDDNLDLVATGDPELDEMLARIYKRSFDVDWIPLFGDGTVHENLEYFSR